MQEDKITDELYELLEEVLDVLLHTKGNTANDDLRRRELVDEITDTLE